MPKYPGRIVSATPPSVSLSGASGVWTLEEVAQYQQAGTWPIATGGNDPYFNQTVLLLHGDGTNGAQNNTFLDSSTNNFTITRNGNTTQGTFSPFSVGAGEWSNYFDGSGDYINTSSTLISTTATTFTIEAWIYMTANPSTSSNIPSLCGDMEGANLNNYMSLGPLTNRTLGFQWFNGIINLTAIGSTVMDLNTWNHIAVVVNSSAISLYVNGVAQSITGTTTITNRGGTTSKFTIGVNSTRTFTGYASNIRVTSTAVYTSNFTPSTVPLGATSGGTNPPQGTETSLLTCQSNRFVDNSTNAFAITRNGDVRVTPFSPFAPSAAYSAGTNGGSGYFDGSGDWLNTSTSPATLSGNFTIEGWVYITSLAANRALCCIGDDIQSTGALFFINTAGRLSIFGNNANILVGTTQTVNINSWNHIAFVRSSNTITAYLNGVADSTTASNSTSFSGAVQIGRELYNGINGIQMFGYISNFRQVAGTAVYNSNFTPPTSPVTAITNTSLLLNFTNAGIFDNTGKNNLETVGNAQIDTTTKKYGTGSMKFDGTGDWLLLAHNPDQFFGTGPFTIEFWVYLATGDIGSARGLVAKGTSTTGWLVSLDSSQKVVFTYTTSTITSTGAITLDAWNYIAVVREGTGSNQTKIYIGGTNDGTGTVSTDFNQTSVMYVGANRTGGDPMKGFIDDLRVTKGVARYTANFTPPAAAFPNF